jgi:hypothetical protein
MEAETCLNRGKDGIISVSCHAPMHVANVLGAE